MRVLILGGTRFIGVEVARQLTVAGHEVIVFHRGKTDNMHFEVPHLLGDRKKLPEYRSQFAELKPDIVLDMLALNQTDADLMVETIRGLVPRVVVISSQDVYRGYGVLWNTEEGPLEPIPFTEDSPLRTSDRPHGDSHDKIAVEKTVMNQPDLAATVLRLPMVYGRLDRQHRMFEFLKRIDDHRSYILLDDKYAQWRWTKGYVDNVAEAICLALTDDRATGQIYNVGEPTTPTMMEWVDSIGRANRWTGMVLTMPKEHLPEHLHMPYNFDQQMVSDSSKIRRELGYAESVPIEQAILYTTEWERHHPPDDIDPKDFDYEAETDAWIKFSSHPKE